jgi:eukaryotic-like serine/threonine-protein kinase
MTVERWTKIQEIYQQATRLLGNERAEYIEETCAGDETLRAEVETLLDSQMETVMESEARTLAASDADHFLTAGQSEDATRVLPSMPHFNDEMIGKQIGAYKIEREVGRGGMGAVYLASRADEQFRNRVAIKLVKRGMGSDFVIRRFLGERQILAYLNHPHIARLLDGGATEDGSPYFVMEYIEGLPITHYCDQHRLSTGERLKLFQQVCSAIQYAHQNLVVHRDIKPGNILVTSSGEVKLLDFGIAKLLAPELSPTDTTAKFGRLMTPDYASPEQVKGEPITTASDIYSLGVLLYQLLTGHRPYHISNTSPMEMVRVICELEPDRPSTVINRSITLAAANERREKTLTPEEVSGLRDSQPDKLRKQLAGDLDNIILKAMRKDPARRYVSAEQFSEDIRRHLQGLPVTARPDTFSYRARKFLQRNRAGVAAAVLLVLSLLGGIIGTTWQAVAARRERARAEKRFTDVRRLANSFLFEFHDSIQNLSGATPARELVVKRALEYLDSLSQEAGNDFSLQRELATAYEKVGDVQGDPYGASLGDTASALESHRKALSIREALSAANPSNQEIQNEMASSYLKLGDISWVQGEWSDALEVYQKARAINERLSLQDPSNRKILYDLSLNYDSVGDVLAETGDLQGALESQQKALAIRQSLAESSNEFFHRMKVGVSYVKVADMQSRGGAVAESLENYSRAMAIFEKLRGEAPDDERIPSYLGNVYQRFGIALVGNKEIGRALEIYDRGRKNFEKQVAEDPADAVARRNLAGTYTSIAFALHSDNKFHESIAYYRKALEINLALAASDPDNAQTRRDIYASYISIGDGMKELENWREAEKNFAEALKIAEELAARDETNAQAKDDLAGTYFAFAVVKVRTGDQEKALEYLGKALPMQEALAAESPQNADYRFALADSSSLRGEAHEALGSSSGLPPNQRLSHLQEASRWYQKALDIMIKMREENILSKRRAGEIDTVSQFLARCNAAIERLSSKR